MPTCRILVFWDVSLWKPQISQLFLFWFNTIRQKRIVCIYNRTMKEQIHLGTHFINGFLYIPTRLKQF